jgi:L-lactate utilization protein LutC
VIEQFMGAVSAWGGIVRRVPTPGAARSTVAELLAEFEARTLCHWQGDALVAAIDPATLATPAPPEHADAGITGAEQGIAATGTLVLSYGAGRGRGVGLLPDVHITVLAADAIVADLPTALRIAYARGVPPAAITLVTGPSASSDIEKIRVTGVHGPRRMGVVVVG